MDVPAASLTALQRPVSSGARRYMATRTVSFLDRGPWGPEVEIENEKHYVESRANRFPASLSSLAYHWFQLQFAMRLAWISRKCDGLAVGRYAIWFPILNRLLRLGKRVVMTDVEWRETGSGKLNRWAALSSDVVCCNTRAEIDRYSRRFGVPPDKFRLVLMAFQGQDIFEARDEGYVFVGGRQGRDWGTLFSAVDGLPYPVRIYTSAKLQRAPSNVTIASVPRAEYYRRMAASSCVVIPLFPEPLRITGTTTWINAMGSGKTVIVTEPHGAPDYMEQGASGFYVDYGDAEGLRTCIERVMLDRDLRWRVGRAARERALAEFSPEVFRQRVLRLLRDDEPPA